jgi:SAM-dependent methyltransferase
VGIQANREKCLALVHKHYAGVPTREKILDHAVLAVARPQHRILDAGCGDDLPLLLRYAPRVSYAVGVDLVRPTVQPIEGTAVVQGDLARLPFGDSTFDLVLSRSVLEHLKQPATVFREFHRLLRLGGQVIFTTPNRYYYSSLIAGLIPYALKDQYMKRVFATDCYDHFPVYYRANTVRAFQRLAEETGFTISMVKAIRHYPFYLMFSPLLFRLGMLYDWIITTLGMDALQSTWLVMMQKD